jgi:hypothetical protein
MVVPCGRNGDIFYHDRQSTRRLVGSADLNFPTKFIHVMSAYMHAGHHRAGIELSQIVVAILKMVMSGTLLMPSSLSNANYCFKVLLTGLLVSMAMVRLASMSKGSPPDFVVAGMHLDTPYLIDREQYQSRYTDSELQRAHGILRAQYQTSRKGRKNYTFA